MVEGMDISKLRKRGILQNLVIRVPTYDINKISMDEITIKFNLMKF